MISDEDRLRLEEYARAKAAYRSASSEFQKKLLRYGKLIGLEGTLMRALAKEEYSKASKAYYEARKNFELVVAISGLSEKELSKMAERLSYSVMDKRTTLERLDDDPVLKQIKDTLLKNTPKALKPALIPVPVEPSRDELVTKLAQLESSGPGLDDEMIEADDFMSTGFETESEENNQ